MCEGKCQHTNGKGIEICNHCGSNSKFCFCRSYCKLHDDTKQNCCPQQCTTTHDYTPDYIILCIIASLFAMAIVSVYYKDEVYSFQMYVAQGGIAVWKRATSDHGPQPSGTRLYSIVASLTLLSVSCLFYLKSLSMNEITGVIAGFGVKLKKIARTSTEIERKMFHLSGLGVPFLYQYLIRFHDWNKQQYVNFCIICTVMIWAGDLLRVYVPAANNYFPFNLMKTILRDKEKNQLSGTCYFSLGCTLAIAIFPSAVATLSIMWLILGDMSAALIGVSFGGETVALKMGREGILYIYIYIYICKYSNVLVTTLCCNFVLCPVRWVGKKSMEGSVAMFVTCVIIGFVVFMRTHMAEYAIVIGALVATLVELYEPLGLNDNVTIPVISCIALQWGLSRIETCR